jgi:hypothetical protein
VHIGILLLQVWIVKIDLGAIDGQPCYIGRGNPKTSLSLCFKEKKTHALDVLVSECIFLIFKQGHS